MALLMFSPYVFVFKRVLSQQHIEKVIPRQKCFVCNMKKNFRLVIALTKNDGVVTGAIF